MLSARRTLAGRVTHGGRGVVAAAVAAVLGAVLSGCTSHPAGHGASSAASSQPPLGYRALPTFLPTSAAPVDRVVTASAGHPQLAEQGVAVQVDLPAGHVLATISGPHVPPFVTPPPPAVTATFDVSLADARGQVPIQLSDFTITDQLGRTFHPTLATREPAPAPTVAAGHTATFRLTAVMPTGEGRIYWSPTHASPLVGWDFIVEND